MQDSSVRHMVLRKYYSWICQTALSGTCMVEVEVWDMLCLEHVEVYKGYVRQLCLAYGYDELTK